MNRSQKGLLKYFLLIFNLSYFIFLDYLQLQIHLQVLFYKTIKSWHLT